MNILVIRNDRFGEFLLNIPAIWALKEAYPQAKVVLAVDSMVYELAIAIERVDEVVVWDKVRKDLRKHKFDIAVVLNPTKEAHWAIFWAGIPTRVGYDRKWGFLLTHKLKDTKHLGNRHEVDCNLELVGLVGGIASAPAAPRNDGRDVCPRNDGRDVCPRNDGRDVCPRNDGGLRIPRNDKYEFLAGGIAIHPFTSDPVKQWPVERFGELAQRIIREMKVKVVLVGKVEDRGQSPLGTVPSEIIDLINKTSLVELAQILKRCKLLLTCDSGPMHLAASVGTPVVALFRNDLVGKTARRWGPWGEGHVVIEKSRLEDISVEEVFEKVKTRLLRPPSADSQ